MSIGQVRDNKNRSGFSLQAIILYEKDNHNLPETTESNNATKNIFQTPIWGKQRFRVKLPTAYSERWYILTKEKCILYYVHQQIH